MEKYLLDLGFVENGKNGFGFKEYKLNQEDTQNSLTTIFTAFFSKTKLIITKHVSGSYDNSINTFEFNVTENTIKIILESIL